MKYFFIFIFIFSIFSCNKNRIFEQHNSIANSVWNVKNVIQFDFSIENNQIPYNIFVNIRHGEMYKNSNLWLFITTISPSGKQKMDTLECVLYDDLGNTKGEILGDICDISVPFKLNVGFKETGNYVVAIQHAMRPENIPFIAEIGLTIEKNEVKK